MVWCRYVRVRVGRRGKGRVGLGRVRSLSPGR